MKHHFWSRQNLNLEKKKGPTENKTSIRSDPPPENSQETEIDMPKNDNELSREDLIALIEERAEDVCGGKMYEVEVKIDELEEELDASKETVKNLEQSLKQAQSDLQSLSQENNTL